MNKEMRKNRRRGKVGRRLIGVFLALNLFISAFSGIVFFHYTPKVAKAADDESNISIKNTLEGITMDPNKTYDLRVNETALKVESGDVQYDDPSHYKIEWKITLGTDKAAFSRDGTVVSVLNQDNVNLYPTMPGDVIVSVKVTNLKHDPDSTTDKWKERSTECHFKVWFAVDTSQNDNIFKYVYSGDEERSLFMHAGESDQTMKLNFGKTTDAQWTSENEEIATVGLRTGVVHAVGAGYTRIKATYTPDSANTYTAYLKVYVIPKAKGEGDSTFSTGPRITLEPDDKFDVDTFFTINSIDGIKERIFWSIRVESGSGDPVEIANSMGKTSELIEIIAPTSTESKLKINRAVAGVYKVFFYVNDGIHTSDLAAATYTPTVATITITSGIKDGKRVVLGTNDILKLPESYGMSTSDFGDTFDVLVTMENDSPAGNYMTYNDVEKSITAKDREGNLKATMTVKTGKEDYVRGLLPPGATYPSSGKFVTYITIVDGITLGEESLVIMVGQEYQMLASVHGTYDGVINWSSSNSSSVSVDTSGMIKGLKVTTDDVTITASIIAKGGIVRTASCQVKVETAMTDFTLNPAGDRFMNVGDVLTLEAKIKETVSKAPLRWISSKEEVFSVTPAADGKTAVINALAGGTGTLMVENTLNGKRVQIDITVRIPITKLEFKQKEDYKFPFYQNGHNMKEELTIEPNDATSTALVWTVDNTKVATIDNAGYLKFLAPGTVSITVRPEHNPNNLYANAIVKIIGGPDEIIFENLKDDHLDIEAGDTKTVNLKFVPDTAETKLIWKTDKAGVCHLDYDEERKQLEVVGQKPGSCTVTCRTDDNVYYSFTVTCTEASTGIEFEKDSVTLYNGDPINGKFQLVPKLKPTTSTDTVTYKMRDDKIATVSDKGLLTAVAAGKTYVSATTSSGKTAIVDVIVVDKVTKVTGDFKRATVYIGEALTISPKITPQTAANKNIKWSWEPYETDDPGSVELDERGSEVIVTGKTEGMVVLTGVSEDNSSAYVEYTLTVKYRTPQYSTKVTLSPKVKYVNVGKKFKVSRSVKNAYNGNKTLKWKSSNRRVATVSSSGRVKARKVGKATISATCLDGSKAKGSMKVVVRRLVTKIKMNKSNANILVGKSVKLSVRITPSNATIKGVKWKSGDTSIATVDGGKVIGVAPGMVKITATSKDATKKKTYCWVTVSEPVPVTNFTIADANLTVAKGSSIQSGMVPNPSNATDSIKYWSDTPSVATVTSRGKIKGVRPGKATIYARAANGVEGHVDVTVVDINRKAVTLLQYATEQLSIYNITTGITWYSAKPEIASVDANGLVKAKLPGKTIIYAYVDGVKLGCEVTVRRIK